MQKPDLLHLIYVASSTCNIVDVISVGACRAERWKKSSKRTTDDEEKKRKKKGVKGEGEGRRGIEPILECRVRNRATSLPPGLSANNDQRLIIAARDRDRSCKTRALEPPRSANQGITRAKGDARFARRFVNRGLPCSWSVIENTLPMGCQPLFSNEKRCVDVGQVPSDLLPRRLIWSDGVMKRGWLKDPFVWVYVCTCYLWRYSNTWICYVRHTIVIVSVKFRMDVKMFAEAIWHLVKVYRILEI